MGALVQGCLARKGKVEATILRRFVEENAHQPGIPLHQVEDMRERKRALEEGSDAIIALPGGLGTFEELTEMLSFRKLALHGRPIILLNTADYFAPWLSQIEAAIAAGFESPQSRSLFETCSDPIHAVELCESLVNHQNC